MGKKNKNKNIDKKEIDNDNKVKQVRPVKKSHGCRNCFVTALVLVIVFCGLLVGGAFFAWGKYVEPQINLTLGEAFKIAGGLFKNTDEGKVVTNPYSQDDLDEFYKQFKTKLFIKESVNINISDILSSTLSKGTAEDVEQNSLANEYSATVMEENNPEVETSGTGSEVLDKLLADLEFDFSSLSNYTGAPNILEITDKSLAAVLNEALSGINIESVNAQLSAMGIDSISSVASIKQVVIAGQDKDVSLKITVGIKARELIQSFVENNEQAGSYKKYIKLIYPLIPKTIYAGVKVFPNDTAQQAQISLNEIDDGLLSKAIAGIDKLTGSVSNLLTTVNTTVISSLEKVSAYLPISFVESGSIETQPISAMMKVLKVDGTVSEGQFLYMIKDLSLPTAESLGYAGYTEEKRNIAVDSLIEEMTVDYGINNADNFITRDNLISVLPTLVSDENNIKRIDLSKLNYSGNYGDIKGNAEVNATYAAVAGLVNNYLANNPQSISLDVTAMNLAYNLNANLENELIVLACVNIKSLLPESLTNGSYGKIIASVLPQYVYVQVKVNLTNAEATASFTMNGLSEQDTEDRMNTIRSLASAFGVDVSALETASLVANVDKAIKDGLANITKSVGDIVYTEDGIVIPDIYSVISRQQQLQPTEEDQEIVTNENIYDIFKSTYTYQPSSEDINVTTATNATAFASQVENKYFLYDKLHDNSGDISYDENGIARETINGADGADLISDLKNLSTTYENSLDINALKSDTRDLEDLRPEMSQEEFGFIVNTSTDLNAAITFMKNTTLISSKIIDEVVNGIIVDSYIEIIVTGDLNIENAGIYGSLMPSKLYINIRVDTVKLKAGDSTCLSFTVDNMNEEQLNKFLVVAKRMGNVTVNKEEISRQTAEKFITTTKDLGTTVNFEFTQGKLMITSTLFDVAVNKLYDTEIKNNAIAENEKMWVPSATQMRTTLVKANTTSILQTNNVETDGQQAVAFNGEVNRKYYLLEEKQLPTTVVENGTSTTVVQALKDLSTNYKNAIDGKAMASDTANLNDLNPTMKGSEFGYIVNSQVDITATMSGVSAGKVNSSYIKKVNGQSIAVLVFDISFTQSSKLVPQVLNVVVEIDMNTQEYTSRFTINDIMNTAEEGELSELDVAVNIMNKTNSNTLAVESINKQIQDSVKKAMIELTNSAKISFEGSEDINADSGRAILDNIYEVAVNSLYKEDIEFNNTNPTEVQRWVPTNVELRRVITSLHTESGLAKDNVASANRAGAFVEEINDKYYLTTPIAVAESEKVLDKIKTLGANYQSISGAKMAEDTREYTALSPTMSGSEFGYLVSENFSLTSYISGIENAVLNSSYVIKKNADDFIQFVFTGTLTEAHNNTLLPKDIDIISYVNTNKEYATTFTINSLSNDASNGEYSDLELAIRILNKFSTEEQKMDINAINNQLTTKMNNHMAEVSNSAQVSFEGIQSIQDNGESGEVMLGTIFDVAVGNIYNQESDIPPTGEDMRATLKALHYQMPIVAELTPNGEQTSITPKVNTSTGQITVSADITDMQLGNIVKQQQSSATNSMYAKLGLSEDSLKFTQSALLLQSDTSDRARALRANYDGVLDINNDYMIMAMSVLASALTAEKLSIMPEYITLTMIMDLSSEEIGVKTYKTTSLYNLLTESQVEILTTIINRNGSGSNVINSDTAGSMRTSVLGTAIVNYGIYTYTVEDVLNESTRATTSDAIGLGKLAFSKTESIILP